MIMYLCSECTPRRYFMIEDGVTIACPACKGRQYSPAEDADAVLAQFRALMGHVRCVDHALGMRGKVRDNIIVDQILVFQNMREERGIISRHALGQG